MSTPQRKCIGCQSMHDKNILIRIVKTQDKVFIDKSGKSDGRGCYVCKNAGCIKKAVKGRRIERAFSMKIDGEIYSELEAFCNA